MSDTTSKSHCGEEDLDSGLEAPVCTTLVVLAEAEVSSKSSYGLIPDIGCESDVPIDDSYEKDADQRSTSNDSTKSGNVEFPIGIAHEEDDDQLFEGVDSSTIRKRNKEHVSIPSGNENDSTCPDSTTVKMKMAKDTYSMMIVAPINSQAWWVACSTFLIQFILFLMIFGSQCQSSANTTLFNAPPHVSSFTRVAQFLAVMVLFLFQKDLADAVLMITLFIDDPNKKENMNKLLKCDVDFEYEPKQFKKEFQRRILLPNICKLVQGCLALISSFVIVIQSSEVVELFKDFSALGVISTVSIIVYRLIDEKILFGYAPKVQAAVKQCEEVSLKKQKRKGSTIHLQSIIMCVVFVVLYALWASVVRAQVSGHYFKQRYPQCDIDKNDYHKIGDGRCDGGMFMHLTCGFDGGDCLSYRVQYPDCDALEPHLIGDGECNELYNKESCDYDGGDCCRARTFEEKAKLGDNNCDPEFNTIGCKYDYGDCEEFNDGFGSKYPFCVVPDVSKLNNGKCDGGEYISESCGFDDGDCAACLERIGYGKNGGLLVNPNNYGDGFCDQGLNVLECEWDGGDCELQNKYPSCNYPNLNFTKLGDGTCDGWPYISEECGHDGGDCDECVAYIESYGGIELQEVGDGNCHDDFPLYNPECNYDGGDCLIDTSGMIYYDEYYGE